MARIRNIKPEFFLNEELAELSAETRLAFIGLWTLADWEGRLADRPKRMRLELFPYHPEANIDEMLNDLARAKFIQRYEVGGEKYIQISNFSKHQFISGKERVKPSTIPEPPRNKPRTKPVSGRNCDTTLHHTDITHDNGHNILSFDAFWELYPRHEGKQAALSAFNKLTDAEKESIPAALDWQRVSEGWTKDGGKFIPHASTYLNQKRFMDEYQRPKQGEDGWTPTSDEVDRLWPHLFGGTQA